MRADSRATGREGPSISIRGRCGSPSRLVEVVHSHTEHTPLHTTHHTAAPYSLSVWCVLHLCSSRLHSFTIPQCTETLFGSSASAFTIALIAHASAHRHSMPCPSLQPQPSIHPPHIDARLNETSMIVHASECHPSHHTPPSVRSHHQPTCLAPSRLGPQSSSHHLPASVSSPRPAHSHLLQLKPRCLATALRSDSATEVLTARAGVGTPPFSAHQPASFVATHARLPAILIGFLSMLWALGSKPPAPR